MVTEEAPRKMSDVTPEEWQEIADRVASERTGLANAIDAGIASALEAKPRTLTEAEEAGIESLCQAIFNDTVLHEFNSETAFWAERLAWHLTEDRLLAKLLGVWEMEGAVTDWSDITDGIVGQAADQAAEALKPYLRAAGRFV